MTSAKVKSDAQIQEDVLTELAWDTRVEEADVGVEVQDGVVTLTGTVPSYAIRLAAQDAAHRVRGVRDVANDIVVRIPGTAIRTDTEIARAVRSALEWDPYIPHERISSTVTQGWVTLQGEVAFWGEREAAERAVRRLQGVRGVINELVAGGGPKADTRALQQQIEEEDHLRLDPSSVGPFRREGGGSKAVHHGSWLGIGS